eukprot:TRINITY_DN16394_c0_g1_i17.p1 TRINITY_DN16394_c0_g1~~TRINITY_DN16394_c0_g1_i17.p1  ORF type:complete len:116 (+),score=16.82 TRINITY_DN16394_c0_g1_i17:131-478(+)
MSQVANELEEPKPPLLNLDAVSLQVPKPCKVFYYDLPIRDDAPEYEIKICVYLHSKGVRMSGPSTTVDNIFTRPASKSSRQHKKGPSLLQSRRKEKFSKNFVNLELAIEVHIKSN